MTAVLLLVTSAAQFALDEDLPGRATSAGQVNAQPSTSVTPELREMVAEELPETALRGRKISQMIFRIN